MVRCFGRISAGIKKDDTPIHIGPVGGRIVAETFVGSVVRDGHSFLAADSDWAPNKERKFLMSDLESRRRSRPERSRVISKGVPDPITEGVVDAGLSCRLRLIT
jgi:hypothetical protein